MLIDKPIKKHIQPDDDGTWILSYADMITLLLAFFILFFTIDPEVKTDEEIKSSLFVALNNERVPASEVETVNRPGDSGSQELEPIFDKVLSEKFDLKAYKLGRRIVVDFPQTSFYDTGNIKIIEEGQKELKRFVDIYMPYAGKYTLGIRAYTDSRKVKSKNLRYKDNLELSALRAVSAMRVMQKMGIPLDRMKLGGYGELKVTQEELENIKPKNNDAMSLARKVVLVIEPEEGVTRR